MPGARCRSRRRASIYAAVLLTSTFVVTVGLTAVAAVRLQGRTLEDTGATQAARLLAQAGLDYALQKIATTSTWRADVAGGGWAGRIPFGNGEFTLNITDPVDGDLTDDPLEPVQIEIRAGAGASRHLNRATLNFVYQDSPLDHALIVGGGVTFVDAVFTANAACDIGGNAAAAASLVDADIHAAGIISGGDYQRETKAGAATITPPNSATILSLYRARAADIAWSDLPSTATNLISNPGFESALSGVSPRGGSDVARTDSGPHAGTYSVAVSSRESSSDGVAIDVTAALQNKQRYVASVWFRTGSTADQVILAIEGAVTNSAITAAEDGKEEKAASESGDAPFAFIAAPQAAAPYTWTQITATFDVSWSEGESLVNAALVVYTQSASARFQVDDVSLAISTTGKQIGEFLLSPTVNPFNGVLNAEGVYRIDCGGNTLEITDARIVGTLLLENPGPKTKIAGSVCWSSAAVDTPALLVNGDLHVELGSATLREAKAGLNLNPSGTPFRYPDGESDNDLTDSYPSEIHGLIYVSGDLRFTGNNTINGPILAGGAVEIGETLTITIDPALAKSPPPGFNLGSITPFVVHGAATSFVE